MNRRDFITLLSGAAVAWPLAVRGQQPDRVRRIGVLMGYAESDADAQAKVAVFREGLQKLGWAEGRNIRIDTRWPVPADAESMQRYANRSKYRATSARSCENLRIRHAHATDSPDSI